VRARPVLPWTLVLFQVFGGASSAFSAGRALPLGDFGWPEPATRPGALALACCRRHYPLMSFGPLGMLLERIAGPMPGESGGAFHKEAKPPFRRKMNATEMMDAPDSLPA